MFLADDAIRTASPLYSKSKQIEQVCNSSKNVETLTISKMVDDVIFTVRQLEILVYRDYQKRIKIELYTDSELTLESIASSRQIERKTLRMTVRDLKDHL